MAITFDEFIIEATKILNINLSGYKMKRVQRRTESLMRRHKVSDYLSCLNLLRNDPEFKAAYLNHFTINTSEFFRNPKNFNYLKDNILPDLLNKYNKIKIWSAPCSNGSEPYTLAIILDQMGIAPSRYKILASDLDPEIIKIAETGIYGPTSLKNVPDNILDTYFHKIPEENNKYQLDEKIMKLVDFEKKDLINEPYSRNWDLILSRNFFIYLTKEIKTELTNKFVSSLKKGGYLFLGNTEFIFNPENFNLVKEHLSFYKRLH